MLSNLSLISFSISLLILSFLFFCCLIISPIFSIELINLFKSLTCGYSIVTFRFSLLSFFSLAAFTMFIIFLLYSSCCIFNSLSLKFISSLLFLLFSIIILYFSSLSLFIIFISSLILSRDNILYF